jgi:hypothetical protein
MNGEARGEYRQAAASYCSKDDEPNAVLTARFRRQEFRLTPAADAPRPAAASAAPAAAAAAPAASPAASTAATTSATPGDFLPELRLCGIFLVEHIECRQADVRDFLVTEKDFMIWRDVLRRNIRHLSAGRCGRSTR